MECPVERWRTVCGAACLPHRAPECDGERVPGETTSRARRRTFPWKRLIRPAPPLAESRVAAPSCDLDHYPSPKRTLEFSNEAGWTVA
jgi:hypothetical protein